MYADFIRGNNSYFSQNRPLAVVTKKKFFPRKMHDYDSPFQNLKMPWNTHLKNPNKCVHLSNPVKSMLMIIYIVLVCTHSWKILSLKLTWLMQEQNVLVQ